MKQTLYYNGSILTMEQALYAPAILIQDGRIAALGTPEQLLSCAEAGENVEKIDLQGTCLMPSFIDAHSHFSGYAMSLLQIPLEEASDFDDIRERIQNYIARNEISEGQWVIAKGYDHNNLTEKRHPSLALLDMAAPHNPLVLQHQSSHMGVFNSCALKLLGVTPGTPDPAGGLIQKENGQLTGYMEENAFIQYFQELPTPSMEEMLNACHTAQERYASNGITTVQEGMFTSQLLPFYEYLLRTESLKLDLAAYADAAHISELEHALPWHTDRYNRHLKLGGMKIFLDGSPQGRTAWMRDPYEPSSDCSANSSAASSDYFGYPTLSDEQVENFVRLAQSKKMQLLAHCNGDAAAAQYLNAWKNAGGSQSLRPVIIHAQLIGTDQLEEVKRLGLIPSFFTAHTYYWGDVHIRNFGFSRASHISPAASAQKLGIPFTFHQDAPVIEPDMLETIWCAVNRITKSGVLLKEEAISVMDALKAVTVNAAFQYFEENSKGSLAPGKLADFVILSGDPLHVPKEELNDIQVLATFKEGACIYRR